MDRCVCCGEQVPEGTIICIDCLKKFDEELERKYNTPFITQQECQENKKEKVIKFKENYLKYVYGGIAIFIIIAIALALV